LPEEIFHLFAKLFPDFIRITESCDLKAVEFFTLWYLKNRGDQGDDDQWVVMRWEVTELLKKEVNYEDNDVDQHLKRLERKGLVLRRRMTAAEGERKVRGEDEGAVVALLTLGTEKLEEVKSSVNQLFASKVTVVPSALRKPFATVALPLIIRIAKHLLQTDHQPTPK
jgi:DNA-binding MarR family transcriptional regulator